MNRIGCFVIGLEYARAYAEESYANIANAAPHRTQRHELVQLVITRC